MHVCHYKDRFVVPAVHKNNPRDYYATFCIDNGKKTQCFTIRPNFKTQGQAMEAAYKIGRAKVDSILEESKWNVLSRKFKQLTQRKKGEKRKAATVYFNHS